MLVSKPGSAVFLSVDYGFAVGRPGVDLHGACDDRISLYPAAPFRLATLLHARMIAREGWDSSLRR